MMNYLKGCLIYILLISSTHTFSQKSFLLKGYVVGNSKELSGVSVTVIGKATNTVTKFKGRFKIACVIGDTIVFENEDKNRYSNIKYAVKDSTQLVVWMTPHCITNSHGESKAYYPNIQNIYNNQSIQLATAISNPRSYMLGYSYYTQPLFPVKDFIPFRNIISFGTNISLCQNNYYLFPNMGIELRNSFKDGNPFYLSLVVPTVKIGYCISDFKYGKKGVGYELEFKFLKCMLNDFHFALAGSYANYLTNNGTFMINLIFEDYSPENSILVYIRKSRKK